MFYLFEVYLLLATLFLAGKDATSYLLKAKQDNGMTASRVKRWHRDGFILAILYYLPLLTAAGWQWLLVSYAFIRISLFDIEFNSSADLNIHYLGGTAWADKIFIKLFGINGAVKKAIVFIALFGILNVLYAVKIIK